MNWSLALRLAGWMLIALAGVQLFPLGLAVSLGEPSAAFVASVAAAAMLSPFRRLLFRLAFWKAATAHMML